MQGGPNYYRTYGSGIYFEDSSNNTIYHNNFENIENNLGSQVQSSNSINYWDDGYPSGGNYWSDYQTRYPNTTEISNSGIGNMPYVIDSQNKDLYPLTQPFNSMFLINYEQEIIPPAVSVVSPLNETYSETNVSLSFAIDKPYNWVGYSLDGQGNVTVNGNTTIADVAYGSHSITVYANSTFGVIGASRTVDFNVAKSEPFASMVVMLVFVTVIAAVVGLVAAMLYRGRRQRKTSNLNN